MKTRSMILSIAFLPLFTARAQQNGNQSGQYTLHVTANKVAPGARAYINFEDKNDTVSWNDNAFTFTGPVHVPGLATVYIDYAGSGTFERNYFLFLTGGDTFLDIFGPYPGDSLSIRGNPLAVDFQYKVFAPVEAFNNQIMELSVKYRSAKEDHDVDSTALKNQLDATVVKCFQVPQDYIRANPSSPVCIEALKMMGKGDVPGPVDQTALLSLFNSLSPDIKNSESGKAYMLWLLQKGS